MISIFLSGILTGLVVALITIYVATKLQQEGNKGKQELLQLIKEQNMFFNARYVGKLIYN